MPQPKDTISRSAPFLAGLAAGAGLMHALDPERGARRRARARDRVASFAYSLDDIINTTTNDLANRARGLVADTRSLFKHEIVDDPVLVERVRSRLGRVCSHPGAIEVTAEHGKVTLAGPALKDEVNEVISAISMTRGVMFVENELQPCESGDDVPGLQGKPRPRGGQPDILQENWAPATRLLAGVVGAGLAATGLVRRDPLGLALGGLGALLLTRGVTNMETGRLLGVSGGRRAVNFQKTITVDAPPERVFDFWRHFENFPRFMSHLKEVRDLGDGRSRWTAAGPAGASVEWEAETTRLEPNRAIAWQSVEGSTLPNTGIVQFEPTGDNMTRITIRLAYNPPAGAVGHVVAALFGMDPKHAMDADLVRFKSLIEQGKATADDGTVTSIEIVGDMTPPGQVDEPRVH